MRQRNVPSQPFSSFSHLLCNWLKDQCVNIKTSFLQNFEYHFHICFHLCIVYCCGIVCLEWAQNGGTSTSVYYFVTACSPISFVVPVYIFSLWLVERVLLCCYRGCIFLYNYICCSIHLWSNSPVFMCTSGTVLELSVVDVTTTDITEKKLRHIENAAEEQRNTGREPGQHNGGWRRRDI